MPDGRLLINVTEPTNLSFMAKNSYFYYDHDACCFVEVKKNASMLALRVAATIAGILVLAVVFTLTMDQFIRTPQEVALMDENAALQGQLDEVRNRIANVSSELIDIKTVDESLYRSLLQTEAIPEDVRSVGVGGTDPFEKFNRFSPVTADLLNDTSEKIEQLERQIGLQSESFRELTKLAEEREVALIEMPAIVPSEGAIVSGYGMRFHPVLKLTRMHYGIDVAVWTGTPVVATGDGIIKAVGKGSSLGYYVKIDHPTAGYTSVYGHLSKIPKNIRRGVKISRGDVIALSGNTGLSSAPHLHYEVHDKNGRALNPLAFIAPSMTPSQYKKLLEETQRSTVSLD
jgi:murein DD-endopeptidase MepM/ murein hydrolase activator NlpD